MTTPTSDRPTTATGTKADEGRLATVGDSVAGAAETVKDTATDAVSRLPEVAATTRAAIEDANRQISAGSDEMLAVGTLLSFGFAMGLLVGGANRFLVGAALVPAAMLGFNLLDRGTRAGKRSGTSSRLQGG
ncbi:MAG TPA: hypothetical protein VGQ31_07155 [Candidatus Limnocylindrales bacterium]|jgi:hypothetical protein|nr:hypothetical protein [Candidatus Limnocylindrales bacterium]